MKLGYLQSEVPFMKDSHIRSYNILLPKINTEKFELILHFVIDHNGIPSIDKANVNEIWFEDAAPQQNQKEEKKDEKMEVDQEQKQVKKEKSLLVSLSLVEQKFGLNRNILEHTIQRESRWENEDLSLRAAHNKRNEIEQFIYSTQQKLDDALKEHITSQEKDVLVKLMNEVNDWFYSELPEVEDMNVILSKTSSLEELGKKVYERYNEWVNVTEAVSKLLTFIGQVESKVVADKQQAIAKNPNSFLSEKDFEELNSTITLYKQKLQEINLNLSKSSKLDVPLILASAVNQYIDDFNKKFTNIYSTAEYKFKEEKRKEEERIRKEKAEKEKAEKEKAEKEKAEKEKKEEKKEEKKDVNMDVD
jgi:hypothetical protein